MNIVSIAAKAYFRNFRRRSGIAYVIMLFFSYTVVLVSVYIKAEFGSFLLSGTGMRSDIVNAAIAVFITYITAVNITQIIHNRKTLYIYKITGYPPAFSVLYNIIGLVAVNFAAVILSLIPYSLTVYILGKI